MQFCYFISCAFVLQSLAEDTHDNSQVLARSIPSQSLRRTSLKPSVVNGGVAPLCKSASSNSINRVTDGHEGGRGVGQHSSGPHSLVLARTMHNSLQDITGIIPVTDASTDTPDDGE